METHVKVLGVLHIVLGALGIFCALILMVMLGGAMTAVAADGDPDAAFAIPILGITGARWWRFWCFCRSQGWRPVGA